MFSIKTYKNLYLYKIKKYVSLKSLHYFITI